MHAWNSPWSYSKVEERQGYAGIHERSTKGVYVRYQLFCVGPSRTALQAVAQIIRDVAIV